MFLTELQHIDKGSIDSLACFDDPQIIDDVSISSTEAHVGSIAYPFDSGGLNGDSMVFQSCLLAVGFIFALSSLSNSLFLRLNRLPPIPSHFPGPHIQQCLQQLNRNWRICCNSQLPLLHYRRILFLFHCSLEVILRFNLWK